MDVADSIEFSGARRCIHRRITILLGVCSTSVRACDAPASVRLDVRDPEGIFSCRPSFPRSPKLDRGFAEGKERGLREWGKGGQSLADFESPPWRPGRSGSPAAALPETPQGCTRTRRGLELRSILSLGFYQLLFVILFGLFCRGGVEVVCSLV